jgi:predicted nucleic acid-binding protein
MLANKSLIEPTKAEIEQAWTDYHAGLAGDAGIVDHFSFVAMRRLGLVEAFTNDYHFTVAGFTTLISRASTMSQRK